MALCGFALCGACWEGTRLDHGVWNVGTDEEVVTMWGGKTLNPGISVLRNNARAICAMK